MSNHNPLVKGTALPNIPWEDRPDGCSDVVWRSARNPVIPRDLIPRSNSIFNSAVVPFEGAFAGVFRCAALCDAATGRLALYYGAADTVTALAFARVGDLVDWVKRNAIG